MKNYAIYAKDKTFNISADSYKLVREKGGFCRYVFVKNDTAVATFIASYVLAIVEI